MYIYLHGCMYICMLYHILLYTKHIILPTFILHFMITSTILRKSKCNRQLCMSLDITFCSLDLNIFPLISIFGLIVKHINYFEIVMKKIKINSYINIIQLNYIFQFRTINLKKSNKKTFL